MTLTEPQIHQPNTGTFHLLPVESFYEIYAAKIVNSGFTNTFDEDEYEGHYLLVCEGDVVLNDHLYLAGHTIAQLSELLNIHRIEEFGEDFLKESPSAIVVLGNLEIKGSLLNYEEYTPFLYVTGNLKAKNLTAGNSCIFIDGDANIEEVLHGYYNDGILSIDGATTTGLFYPDDHCIELSSLNLKYKSFKQARKDKLIIKDINEDEILEYLYEGRSIFTASAALEIQDRIYWLREVKRSGKRLKYVPAEYMDEEIILAAISEEKKAYKNIPREFQTEELILKAIAINPYIAEYISKKNFTKKIAEIIVRQNGYLLENVPLGIIDKEVCYAAIEGGVPFNSIPMSYLNEEMACKLIHRRKDEIKKAPSEVMTLKFLVEAAKLGDLPLPYHKRLYEYYDEELAIGIDNIGLEAIKEGVEVLDKLPGFVVTKTVYETAEKLYATGETSKRWEEIKERHGFGFYKYFSRFPLNETELKEIEKNPDDERLYGCDNAGKDVAFTAYLWNVFWTKEYVTKVIKTIFRGNVQSSLPIYIPESFFTPVEGMTIVKSSFHNFENLPLAAIDYRVCQYAVAKSPYNIKYVPTELIDEELCILVVSEETNTEFGESEGSGYYLSDIPYQYRTERVCREALKTDKRCISAIPEKYKYLYEE